MRHCARDTDRREAPSEREQHQRRRGDRGGRVRRHVPAVPDARGRLRRRGARDRRRRGRHVVLEPVPGRPLRHPQRRLLLQLGPRTPGANGPGRSATPPSPRSSGTPNSSPTSTTCGATSASTPASSRPPGTTTRSAGRSTPTTAPTSRRSSTSWPRAACRCRRSPDIEGTDRFAGEVYFTSTWPHDGVDFTGKRVAVIGTGSSAVQSIPLIAEQAEQLTVFQRTPNFSIPARNGPISEERIGGVPGRSRGLPRGGPPLGCRRATRRSPSRARSWCPTRNARPVTRRCGRPASYSASPARSTTRSTNAEANDTLCELHPRQDPLDRATIPRSPRRCARRTTTSAPSGRAWTPTTTRPTTCHTSASSTCARTPITTITETGIDTAAESFEFDAIVFATGFDAMTGAIVGVDITGRDGVALKDKWAHGPGDVPRADDLRVPEPVHDHRARQPIGAVEHDGVDRAARRLDQPTRSTTSASTTSTRSNRPTPPRRNGSSTTTSSPISR